MPPELEARDSASAEIPVRAIQSCLAAVGSLLAKTHACAPEGIRPFTPRPPLRPTEMSVLAPYPVDESRPPVGGVPPTLGLSPPALRPREPSCARQSSSPWRESIARRGL